jgi:hypothetical protein
MIRKGFGGPETAEPFQGRDHNPELRSAGALLDLF